MIWYIFLLSEIIYSKILNKKIYNYGNFAPQINYSIGSIFKPSHDFRAQIK